MHINPEAGRPAAFMKLDMEMFWRQAEALRFIEQRQHQRRHQQHLGAARLTGGAVAPQLVELFGTDHFTRVEWEQRLALPVGIATWLHGYYASHREPFPVSPSTIDDILITHAHADHLSAADYIRRATGAQVVIGREITRSIFGTARRRR